MSPFESALAEVKRQRERQATERLRQLESQKRFVETLIDLGVEMKSLLDDPLIDEEVAELLGQLREINSYAQQQAKRRGW